MNCSRCHGLMVEDDLIDLRDRITSYNVCYTKLLRTLLVASVVYWVVPEHAGSRHPETLSEQVKGIRQILGSRVFWRIAPWTIASQAVFLSVQGLWSGPWLRDVAGYGRMEVADTLLLIAVAMIA